MEQTVRADSYVEGSDARAQDVAKELIVEGMPLEKVSKVTKLSLEVVTQLARAISEDV